MENLYVEVKLKKEMTDEPFAIDNKTTKFLEMLKQQSSTNPAARELWQRCLERPSVFRTVSLPEVEKGVNVEEGRRYRLEKITDLHKEAQEYYKNALGIDLELERKRERHLLTVAASRRTIADELKAKVFARQGLPEIHKAAKELLSEQQVEDLDPELQALFKKRKEPLRLEGRRYLARWTIRLQYRMQVVGSGWYTDFDPNDCIAERAREYKTWTGECTIVDKLKPEVITFRFRAKDYDPTCNKDKEQFFAETFGIAARDLRDATPSADRILERCWQEYTALLETYGGTCGPDIKLPEEVDLSYCNIQTRTDKGGQGLLFKTG